MDATPIPFPELHVPALCLTSREDGSIWRATWNSKELELAAKEIPILCFQNSLNGNDHFLGEAMYDK